MHRFVFECSRFFGFRFLYFKLISGCQIWIHNHVFVAIRDLILEFYQFFDVVLENPSRLPSAMQRASYLKIEVLTGNDAKKYPLGTRLGHAWGQWQNMSEGRFSPISLASTKPPRAGHAFSGRTRRGFRLVTLILMNVIVWYYHQWLLCPNARSDKSFLLYFQFSGLWFFFQSGLRFFSTESASHV